jgi:hypothetical protein
MSAPCWLFRGNRTRRTHFELSRLPISMPTTAIPEPDMECSLFSVPEASFHGAENGRTIPLADRAETTANGRKDRVGPCGVQRRSDPRHFQILHARCDRWPTRRRPVQRPCDNLSRLFLRKDGAARRWLFGARLVLGLEDMRSVGRLLDARESRLYSEVSSLRRRLALRQVNRSACARPRMRKVRFRTCSSFGTDFNIAGSILVGVAPAGMFAIMVPGSRAVGGAARVAFAAGA